MASKITTRSKEKGTSSSRNGLDIRVDGKKSAFTFKKEKTRVGGTMYNPIYKGKPFTAFHTVRRDTRLEELNLNWRERDLPERERTKHVHRLHPYLGKFIPQLVEIFLRKYFESGMTVADPFAGSGTTLVQANELGIHSIGYDVSAFNVLLMRAKTMPCDTHVLRAEVADALHRAQEFARAREELVLPFEDITMEACHYEIKVSSEYLKRWYAPLALRELMGFRKAIEEQKYQYNDILKVLLSRAARSARLTTHFDLDFPKEPVTQPYFCYKHRRMCLPTESAMKFLVRYSQDTIKRIWEFQRLRTDAKVEIIHGDSRVADIPEIDGVFTSPPYVGLIDYHEQHAYAYHLLGLEDCREREIGSAAYGTSARARERYVSDVACVFERFLDKMSKGGYMIVVAGDKYGLYPEIAARLNVVEEGVINRHVNRRTGRRSTPFFESVFIWRKK